MGLLNGGIAGAFAKAFAGIYLPATLHKATLVYDDGGSAHATYDSFSCRAQVDSATEAMRQTPGYTERTVRVLVLKDTLAVTPSSDDTLDTGGNSYRVMSVTTDPANSYWEMAAERG